MVQEIYCTLHLILNQYFMREIKCHKAQRNKLSTINFTTRFAWPIFHKSMKQFCLIIILISTNLGYAKLALTSVGAEKLSNVFSLVESADKQFAASNYVVCLAMYSNAEKKLSKLMELALVDPIKCRKYLLEYNKKRESCEPLAALQAHFRLKDIYLTNRLNFLDSLSNNNIRTMNILLDKVVKSYDDLSKLSSVYYMPTDLPRVTPPNDVQYLYSNYLLSFRTNWVRKLGLASDQLFAFNQIASATSLTYHIYWLESANKKENSEITLSWLQSMYEKLVEQEPCNYGFWYGFGNSYVLQNKTRQANNVWHKALKFFPDSLYIHFHLAKTCSKTKNETYRSISHL